MTQEFTLRAMANNYANGHQWDKLDGEACIKAADEIASLKAQDRDTIIEECAQIAEHYCEERWKVWQLLYEAKNFDAAGTFNLEARFAGMMAVAIRSLKRIDPKQS